MLIQTMWKERLISSDIEKPDKLILRIEGLKKMGCSLLRFAVPDPESADLLGKLSTMVSMPLVADIHFDHKIALRCLDFPIAKIRINPGNFGHRSEAGDKIKSLLDKAGEKSVPIRIGINGGSLPRDLQKDVDNGSLQSDRALFLAAERELSIFEEFNFTNVLVSIKASTIADTINANRLFAEKYDVPLHIGVTEAGPLIAGVVRSTFALAELLKEGIGDTIRVSLSDTVEREVITAREILRLVNEIPDIPERFSGKNGNGISIISCPRCGRASFDTHAFTERWQNRLYGMDKNIIVAIMGCEVNGPGEARHADLGITGTGNRILIFSKGKLVRTVDNKDADSAFEEELERVFDV